MSDYYPPGVTGAERQIAGDAEWETFHEWLDDYADTHGLEPHELKALIIKNHKHIMRETFKAKQSVYRREIAMAKKNTERLQRQFTRIDEDAAELNERDDDA